MRQLRTGHTHNFSPSHWWLCKKIWIYEKSFMLQIISLSVFMLISSRAGRKEGKCNFWKADYNHQSYVFYSMRRRGCVEPVEVSSCIFCIPPTESEAINSHSLNLPNIIDFTEPLLKLIKIAQKLIVRVLLCLLVRANLWSLCCTRKWRKIFHIFIMNFLWVIFILISSAWLTWATTNKQNEDSEKRKSIKTKLDMRKKRKNSPSDFFSLCILWKQDWESSSSWRH